MIRQTKVQKSLLYNSKIINAKSAISRTTSSSTIQSKLREIEQTQKSLAVIDKKIASKNKEFITEEKRFRQEEDRMNKKRKQDKKNECRIMSDN
jgi:KaiC/GvpD/RAD55 family RecA-like ATPase